MARIESIEDLKVWKCAREVVNLIYDATDKDDFARDFALKDQIRRSGISVVSNIAEGFERDGNKEFLNFLSIAKGSCGEARAQLYVALDRGYVSRYEFEAIGSRLKETSRMIYGLIRYLRNSDYKGSKFN
ncbi:MAG: four helix bundle protein [Aridibacter famidurans]|nr:four helix bundle protein [Aridibacter famidurans]